MSLSKRLREAALERAMLEGQRVDDLVFDRDGVIDLRALEERTDVNPASSPAAALGRTRGHIAGRAGVDDLYTHGEQERRSWPFTRRSPRDEQTAPSPGAGVVPPHMPGSGSQPRLSSLPVSEPAPAPEVDLTPPAPEIDLTRPEPAIVDPAETPAPLPAEPTADDTMLVDDGARPTMRCPKCGDTGRRDLLDPVSRVEFFSCDTCVHMWQHRLDS